MNFRFFIEIEKHVRMGRVSVIFDRNYGEIYMPFKKIFSKHSETHEQHEIGELKTRYYKTTAKDALNTLIKIYQQTFQATIHAISEERGEIGGSINHEGKKAFVVASVVTVKPFQTAIDFTVTTETVLPFDFGYSTKLVKSFYHILDKKLPKIIMNENINEI